MSGCNPTWARAGRRMGLRWIGREIEKGGSTRIVV
jgi:hypothetical protein